VVHKETTGALKG